MFLPTLSGLAIDITIQFIEHARRELCYFVAEVDGIVVGSSGSQLFAVSPECPRRATPEIWLHLGVYVEPPCRGQGIKKLTDKALEYLKSIGCTSCPTCLAIG